MRPRTSRFGRSTSFCIAASCAAIATFAIAAWAADDWRAARYLLFYVAPLVAFGPWWLLDRSDVRSTLARGQIAIDVAVVLLSLARMFGGSVVPLSGHALFLTHAAITTRRMALRCIAVGLLGITAWFKLIIWSDSRTLIVGAVLGGASGGAWILLARKGGHGSEHSSAERHSIAQR